MHMCAFFCISFRESRFIIDCLTSALHEIIGMVLHLSISTGALRVTVSSVHAVSRVGTQISVSVGVKNLEFFILEKLQLCF